MRRWRWGRGRPWAAGRADGKAQLGGCGRGCCGRVCGDRRRRTRGERGERMSLWSPCAHTPHERHAVRQPSPDPKPAGFTRGRAEPWPAVWGQLHPRVRPTCRPACRPNLQEPLWRPDDRDPARARSPVGQAPQGGMVRPSGPVGEARGPQRREELGLLTGPECGTAVLKTPLR